MSNYHKLFNCYHETDSRGRSFSYRFDKRLYDLYLNEHYHHWNF